MPEKAALRFQRSNFVVSDIPRALTFYRDVLGFEVAFQKEPTSDIYAIAVFEIPPNAAVGLCVLSAPEQPRIMALTEVKNVPLPRVPFPRRSAIVLEMNDPDAVIAGARKLGLQVYEEDMLVTNDGRTGREIGIVDFDNNLVVVYKILKASS